MVEVNKEYEDIKKDIFKCYKQNKFTKKISWLSLPISLIIFVISRLVVPLGFFNIIPVYLSFLNFLIMPTFKILNKIKHMLNTIKNNKEDLELDKVNEIYHEIKKFYDIGEIPSKYLWISFITIIISFIGILLSNYMILFLYSLPIIAIGLITSLALSVKEIKDGKSIIQELGKIFYELEEKEKNKELEIDLNKDLIVEQTKVNDYNYQNNLEDSILEEHTKVLKKGSRPF